MVVNRRGALAALVGASLIGACVTSTETPTPPDGQGRNIECSSRDTTWDFCLRKAREVCGAGGYDLLDKRVRYAGSRYISRTITVDCVE